MFPLEYQMRINSKNKLFLSKDIRWIKYTAKDDLCTLLNGISVLSLLSVIVTANSKIATKRNQLMIIVDSSMIYKL